jgi:hypothetical protein
MKHVLFCMGFTVIGFTALAQDNQKDYSKPEATEVWGPTPKIVASGKEYGAPPSDAIVLFSGKNQDNWVSSKDGAASQWELQNGVLVTKKGAGNIQTQQKFGDCQLHIEFMMYPGSDPGHLNEGNSGVYLQERYEVQIYDSHQDASKIYVNGQCGSLYKQAIPLVNTTKKRGEWNVYDIYYTAPKFRYNGTVEKPAYITVVQNGVLIINHFEIQGTIRHAGIPQYEPHGKASVMLQEHGAKVGFRNIWIREI